MSDSDDVTSTGGHRLGADFGLRAASALVMAAVALAATWLGGWIFALLVIAGCIILCWEWMTLTRGKTLDSLFFILVATTVGMVAALAAGVNFAGFHGWLAVWLFGGLIMIVYAKTEASALILGLDYIGLPALALIWLRNDPAYGLAVIMFLFVVVWGTDIMAYVCGRLFGGAKLWPAVSPNKTWSGAIGGTVAAMICGGMVALAVAGASPWRLALIALVLSIVAQAGDLAESALKRRYDKKDASGLIPGHGGLLDRVDGLLFAAFAAGLYAFLFGRGAPAQTLLIGS